MGGAERVAGGGRAVRYHLKFTYHNTIVRVSRYTLDIDTSHDMAYT